MISEVSLSGTCHKLTTELLTPAYVNALAKLIMPSPFTNLPFPVSQALKTNKSVGI